MSTQVVHGRGRGAGSTRSRRAAVLRLRDAVLPEGPPSSRARRRRTAVFAVVAGLVAYLRLPPGVSGSLWAEDGTQFLADELASGVPSTLVDPYAGYMHLFPRLAAALAGRVPTVWVDDVFVLAACAAVALSATAVLVLSRGHLPWRGARLLAAGMVVLLPTGGLEASANTANSHWFLMLAAFWAMTSRPSSAGAVLLAGVVVAVAVLSDPLTLLLLPLLVARLLLLRGRRDHVVTLVFLAGAALQLAVVLSTERTEGEPTLPPGSEPDPTPSPGQSLASYVARVPFVLGVGVGRASDLFTTHGWAAVVLVTGVLAAAGLVASLGDGRTRWVAVSASAASAAYYVVPVTISWHPRFDVLQHGVDPFPSSRYSVVPMLLLVAVVAAALQAVRSRLGRPAAGAALGLVVVLAALSVVPALRPTSTPRSGPLWGPAAVAAERTCREDPTAVEVTVQIAPDRPNWVVALPCERLR